MTLQNPAQPLSPPALEAQAYSRLPIRTAATWEKLSIEKLNQCLELTSYGYHWQSAGKVS